MTMRQLLWMKYVGVFNLALIKLSCDLDLPINVLR